MTAPVILCENYDDLLRLCEALAAVPAPYAKKAARRAEFVERIREGQRDSDGLWREPEGSDTSMASQLEDSGYGSAGPM